MEAAAGRCGPRRRRLAEQRRRRIERRASLPAPAAEKGARVGMPRPASTSAAAPSSTRRPRYMTPMRSLRCPTTPRSCEMSRNVRPRSARSASRRLRICAWIDDVERGGRLVEHEQPRVGSRARARFRHADTGRPTARAGDGRAAPAESPTSLERAARRARECGAAGDPVRTAAARSQAAAGSYAGRGRRPAAGRRAASRGAARRSDGVVAPGEVEAVVDDRAAGDRFEA